VELKVADGGEGIDEAQLEKIFQPFVTTKEKGLGLGLSISRSIIGAHSGRLWAENARVGTGAVFHLTLPSGEPLVEGSPLAVGSLSVEPNRGKEKFTAER
jgi:two-component system sensor kinase FixL